MNGPLRKRPRYISSWESSFPNETEIFTTRFGLIDLFGSRRRKHDVNHREGGESRDSSVSDSNSNVEESFFTLRMEHRKGGAMAQHFGEERIILFRSDQPGAIAKIIFSSSPAEESDDESDDPKAALNNNNGEGSELFRMAQAKVHVLSVKEPYRGYDLGGLLFSAAMSSLRQRYHKTEDASSGEKNIRSRSKGSVRCQLDAEEDVQRHNKLVGFYEQLGCHIKPNAKISYINNNDRETYRKIPMQIALLSQDMNNQSCRTKTELHEHSSMLNFLPVALLEAPGRRVSLSNQTSTRLDWLALETNEGLLQFRTTTGLLLIAGPDGQCKIVAQEDNGDCDADSTWSKFQLLRVSDARQIVPDGEEHLDYDTTSQEARQKKLWIVKSAHGSFLHSDPVSHLLSCSREPAFWQADNHDYRLTCTSDTPPRRQHYRKMWEKQTVAYVTSLRERYTRFSLAKMSIKRALDLVKDIPANPFSVDHSSVGPSLRTLLYRTAEIARGAGHPDWVQFLALIHGLGSVLNCIDPLTAAESDDDYDWTICSSSRVIGCKAPDRAIFSEFRGFNNDEKDDRYNFSQGMYEAQCGFENVMLTWTGPEYMYHMLKHNSIDIPEEGFSILRLFALRDWHNKGGYGIFANEDDEDVQPFIVGFDELRRDARNSRYNIPEMNDEDCNLLWRSHYSHIVSKYGGDRLLKW